MNTVKSRNRRKLKKAKQSQHYRNFGGKAKPTFIKFRGVYNEERFKSWFDQLSEYDADQVVAELRHKYTKHGGDIDLFASKVENELPSKTIDRETKAELAHRLIMETMPMQISELKEIELKFVQKMKTGVRKGPGKNEKQQPIN